MRRINRLRGLVALELMPGLFSALKEEAINHGVSVPVWIKAILMEYTGIHPGLTHQTADTIKESVRGD